MPDSVPNDATGYVFAAYAFFLLVIVAYVGILGRKFQRLNREIDEIGANAVTVAPEDESRASGD